MTQWDRYGGDNGYAIGFYARGLWREPNSRLYRVVYDRDKQIAAAKMSPLMCCAITSPVKEPSLRRSTRSLALMSPRTSPRTTTSRAEIFPETCPLRPIVTRLPGKLIVPLTFPSMYNDSEPITSPLTSRLLTSRGKFDRPQRTTAGFTDTRLDGYGLCCSLPTRPRVQASYPILVHRHTPLLHASMFVLLLIVLLPQAACHGQEAHLRVDLGAAGKNVSLNQFGIFLEEINHAGDGGLYNELIRNGSFSEAATLDAWSIIRANSAKVNLFFDDSMPLNTAKPRSLRLEIESPGGDKVGVSNEGYWGISVKQG